MICLLFNNLVYKGLPLCLYGELLKVQAATGANPACCRLAPYLSKNEIACPIKADTGGNLQQDIHEILA